MCLQYKLFENTVGKGEIARNEQFLLFLQCFQPILRPFFHFLPFSSNLKLSSANSFSLEESKIYHWERVDAFNLVTSKILSFGKELTVPKTNEVVFDRIEKILRKGENPGYLHFLLFPLYFQNASSTGLL